MCVHSFPLSSPIEERLALLGQHFLLLPFSTVSSTLGSYGGNLAHQ